MVIEEDDEETSNDIVNRLDEDLEYDENGEIKVDVDYTNRPYEDVVKDIINIPQGVYQFSFTSALPTNFGMNYLPLEVEVYLLNRSGRDETGYFAPLE